MKKNFPKLEPNNNWYNSRPHEVVMYFLTWTTFPNIGVNKRVDLTLYISKWTVCIVRPTFRSFISPSSWTMSSLRLSCRADILCSSSSFRCLGEERTQRIWSMTCAEGTSILYCSVSRVQSWCLKHKSLLGAFQSFHLLVTWFLSRPLLLCLLWFNPFVNRFPGDSLSKMRCTVKKIDHYLCCKCIRMKIRNYLRCRLSSNKGSRPKS